MKFTCLTEKLAKALEVVERFTGKSESFPILKHVLLETDKGRLRLSATDLELGIRVWMSGKIEKEGRVALQARTLSQFINQLKEQKVSFEQSGKKKNDISIKSGSFKVSLPGISADEFPIIPKIKAAKVIKISPNIFLKGLVMVQTAAVFSDTRPEISGVHLRFEEKDGFRFVATDTYRLAEYKATHKFSGSPPSSLTLPLRTVQELIRILPHVEKDMELEVGEHQLQLNIADLTMISRVIEGNFPDYQKIIPTQFASTATIKRDAIVSAIKTLSIFSPTNNDIHLRLSPSKKVTLSCQSQEQGSASTYLEADINGDELEIAFNWRYLLDGLQLPDSEAIVLNFSGPDKPAVIRPPKGTKFQYLVMPITKI